MGIKGILWLITGCLFAIWGTFEFIYDIFTIPKKKKEKKVSRRQNKQNFKILKK